MTEQEKKQKALSISIKEGSAASFSSGIADTYITPFALILKASPLHIGFLNALSGLAAPLSQYLGDKLMLKYSRKKIVRIFVFLQALMWFPIAFLSYFLWKGIAQEHLALILIIIYSILAAFGGIAYPAWFTWMGDLVPENKRGFYFAKRQKITGAFGLTAVLIGGFLLDIFKTKGLILLGFSILFIIASLTRFVSFFFFKKQYSPQFKMKKRDEFSLFSFLKRFDNFGKFAVYHALFNFAIMIASPFFAVYMLQDLGFSYTIYTIINMSSVVFSLLFTPLVGKISDKYGNKILLSISTLLFSINPLLWIFIKSPVLLIFIPQVLVGLANAALTISVSNFTYDSTSQKHRAICITYTNILSGIAIFIGSLLGGFLLDTLASANRFFYVFLLAALARFLVSLIIITKVKETKKVKKLPAVHVILLHPVKSFKEEVHWFMSLIK